MKKNIAVTSSPIVATIAWAKCVTFNTVVSLSQKLNHKKLDHKKLDKKREKIDKNETFILQHRPGNHIVAINQQQLL